MFYTVKELRNYTRSAEHALLISRFECSFRRLSILTLALYDRLKTWATLTRKT